MYKQLRFNKTGAKLVKGLKSTWTWRFFDDKAISVGDNMQLVEVKDGEDIVFGIGAVEEVIEMRLKDLTKAMVTDKLGFNDEKELIQEAKEYYDLPIDENSAIKIIRFKYQPQETINLGASNPKKEPKHIYAKIFTDGGSRGNPGPAASGYVLLTAEDAIIDRNGVYIGVTTNNQAEYRALKFALEDALVRGIKKIDIFMDSMLIVNQMKGTYKIKNQELIPIYNDIKEQLKEFDDFSFTHVPRALNKLADAEVNIALDNASAKN